MRKKLLLIVFVTLVVVSAAAQAQEPNRAGLIVQFPEGRVETACVEFSENEITGVDLLNRSGLVVNIDYSSGLGAAVCKISDTGCSVPDDPCFCQCQGSSCNYWNYWQLKDGQWAYSPLGAGNRRLGDGDVDGWVWGDGKQSPELLSLADICPAETETPEAMVTAFTSPLDTPTAQPTPTQLPTPTATSPASPLTSPTPTSQPAISSTSTPASQVFIPSTSGQAPTSESPQNDLPPSPDRYVGLAGVLAVLGFIVLTIWRRRTGV
jgi:hypothetical protein